MAVKQAMDSLGYWVGVVVDSLCVPAEGDVKEKIKRQELEQ